MVRLILRYACLVVMACLAMSSVVFLSSQARADTTTYDVTFSGTFFHPTEPLDFSGSYRITFDPAGGNATGWVTIDLSGIPQNDGTGPFVYYESGMLIASADLNYMTGSLALTTTGWNLPPGGVSFFGAELYRPGYEDRFTRIGTATVAIVGTVPNAVVPVPSALILGCAGILRLAIYRRRKRLREQPDRSCEL